MKTALVSAALLSIIVACSSSPQESDSLQDSRLAGDINQEVPEGTELHRMHFVLHSQKGWAPEGEDYVLHLGGARVPLSRHDEVSKSAHPDLYQSNNNLSDLPTHYADALIPTGRPTRFHITQRSDHGGLIAAAHGTGPNHGLVMVGIHVPESAARPALQKLAVEGRLTARHHRYLINSGKTDGDVTGDLSSDLLHTYAPDQIAEALLFHHPELMTADSQDSGTVMHSHIQTAEGLTELSEAIYEAGYMNWFEMVPIVDGDGNQISSQADHDGDGQPDNEPMYQYKPTDEVLAHAASAMHHSLKSSKNDSTLKDKLYHPTTSASHLEEDAAGEGSNNDRTYTYTLNSTGFHYGFRTRMETDGTSVTLYFRNDYLRHLSVFIEFFDENDGPATPEDWTSNTIVDLGQLLDLSDDNTRFLTLVDPVPTIVGIPIGGDYTEQTVTFDWPSGARYAKVRAGGLGASGNFDFDIMVLGASLTGIFELAFPTVLLTLQSGDEELDVKEMIDNIELIQDIASFGISILGSSTDPSASDILKVIAIKAANFIWGNDSFREELLKLVEVRIAEEAVPFVGWALWAMDLASTAAQLIQTTVEIIESPIIIENRITVAHDVNIIIQPDPKDSAGFPATATEYKVALKLSESDTRVVTNPMPTTTSSSPLRATFDNVPAGGHFDLEVTLYSDTGWVAGHVLQHRILNVNDENQADQTVTLAIRENLVPLSSDTLYSHKEVLRNDGGETHWFATTEAPNKTIASLSHTMTVGSISQLVDLSISPDLTLLGYSWMAASPGLPPCPGSPSGAQLYSFKTFSYGQDPAAGLASSACGTNLQPYILLDPGATEAAAEHLVIQPSADGRYFARDMTIVSGTITPSTLSYGYFPAAVDGIVRHPTHRLIAINRSSSKLMVLPTPPGDEGTGAAYTDEEAPAAVPMAGMSLNRQAGDNNPALMNSPVGIRLGPDGVVLVLDDVHNLTTGTDQAQVRAQLKAFTYDGTPAPYFQGATYLDLTEQDSSIVVNYLDFVMDLQRYVFVLSYKTPRSDPNHSIEVEDYRLDIFQPDGTWLARTEGLVAARMALDPWRNLYSLNYEAMIEAGTLTEPSISQWIPSTPTE